MSREARRVIENIANSLGKRWRTCTACQARQCAFCQSCGYQTRWQTFSGPLLPCICCQPDQFEPTELD